MKRCSGYTLLEVVLSLILVTAVLVMVTAAINLQLNHLSAGRMQTEEARLARAILDKIAHDIRNVVVAQTDDADGSDTAVESDSLDSETGTGSGSSTSTSSETVVDSGKAPEIGFVGTAPGIYGGTDWIQIDTKRILFGERFATKDTRNVELSDDLKHDRLSERKTTLYYLGDDTGTVDADEEIARNAEGSIAAPESPDQEYDKPIYKYGLYYRSLDRLIAEYAIENGDETDIAEDDEPLAPEVDDIEFLYYDGEEWLSEWDMDEDGALPIAVRVILSIRRQDFDLRDPQNSSGRNTQYRRAVTYSLTIPTSMELLQTTDEESSATTTGTGTQSQ